MSSVPRKPEEINQVQAKNNKSKILNKKCFNLKEQCDRAIVQAKNYLMNHPSSISRISVDPSDKESYISQKIIQMVAMDVIKEQNKSKKKRRSLKNNKE